MNEDLERVLRIEIPACSVEGRGGSGDTWDTFTNSNGWEVLGSVMYWQGSIDLSGYALDRKTFYPMTAFVQEAQPPISFGGSGQLTVYLISSVPTDITTLVTQIAFTSAPGFTQAYTAGVSQDDWTTVLFGQADTYLINSTLPSLGITQLISSKQFGSLSPTAADKLYVTKVVLPSTLAGVIGTKMSIPSSRIVIPGSMMQEPKLEYMMRLKRSYELANQV